MKLHYYCNNRCIFCHCDGHRNAATETDRLSTLLGRIPTGVTQILLSGGEPTIYPDLKNILSQLKQQNLTTGFITNGRMFAYPAFARMAIEARSEYFYISLHASKSEIHDRITGSPGSFHQTVTGINNLSSLSGSIEIVLNCVVTRENADDLLGVVAFVRDLGGPRLKFSVPEWKGSVKTSRDRFILPLSEAAERIGEAMVTARRSGVRVSYDGLPYCFLPVELREANENLETNRIFFMAEAFEERFHPTDESLRFKNLDCHNCSFDSVCRGTYCGYETDDHFAVMPIRQTVPNSFSLILKDKVNLPDQPCPAQWNAVGTGVAPDALFVQSGQHAERYEARSPFFKREEFAVAVAEGQIYELPPSDGSLLSIPNLLRVRLRHRCSDCNDLCLGVFDRENPKPFFAFSAQTIDRLMRLQGDVLEVGSGDVLLSDWFFNRLEGRIHYTGLEPDVARVTAARQAFPAGRFVHGAAEQDLFPPESFDWVLMLGSYGHIADLPQAFSVIRRILKPGGTLLIIENSVFGVLQQESLSDAIESADGTCGYEHYRNHELIDAVRTLKDAGFSVSETENLSPDSSFWIAVAAVTAG